MASVLAALEGRALYSVAVEWPWSMRLPGGNDVLDDIARSPRPALICSRNSDVLVDLARSPRPALIRSRNGGGQGYSSSSSLFVLDM